MGLPAHSPPQVPSGARHSSNSRSSRALRTKKIIRFSACLSAWLFTIHQFRSEYRKRLREVEDTDGHHVGSLKSPPQQHSHVELEESGPVRSAHSCRRIRLLLRARAAAGKATRA